MHFFVKKSKSINFPIWYTYFYQNRKLTRVKRLFNGVFLNTFFSNRWFSHLNEFSNFCIVGLKGGENKNILSTLELVKQFFTGNEIIVEIRNDDNDMKIKFTCNLQNDEPYKLENTCASNNNLNTPFILNKNIENIIKSLKIETENKRIKEIVKNMIKENIDISLISKITYLTIDEIENLK